MSAGGPRPVVSVVVPARNAADVIGDQLAALARQTYAGSWEVLLADNGSIDGTLHVARRWEPHLPALTVVDASDRPGGAHARNAGAARARGQLLAFCDSDDVVADGWLDGLVRALAEADVVGGPLEVRRLNSDAVLAWRPALAERELPVSNGFLPYAHGANMGVRADVFRRLGGFRDDYPAGDDVELCWRAHLAGYRVAFAPGAVVHYRYRAGLAPLMRQFVTYGAIAPRLYRDYRAAGMPPSPLRGALGPWARLLGRLPVALTSPERRGDVLRRISLRWGRILGSAQARVGYF